MPVGRLRGPVTQSYTRKSEQERRARWEAEGQEGNTPQRIRQTFGKPRSQNEVWSSAEKRLAAMGHTEEAVPMTTDGMREAYREYHQSSAPTNGSTWNPRSPSGASESSGSGSSSPSAPAPAGEQARPRRSDVNGVGRGSRRIGKYFCMPVASRHWTGPSIVQES
jgi:hypothetical protein